MSEANGEYHPVSGWVVQIEPGVWLATWRGDPGRTLVEGNAKRFKSAYAGECALRQARRWRPFVRAFVYQPNANLEPRRLQGVVGTLNQEDAMKKMKTIKRTYEHTPKGDKLVARVTDKYGDEVFYGDPEEAQLTMARKPMPGEVLRCETFYV